MGSRDACAWRKASQDGTVVQWECSMHEGHRKTTYDGKAASSEPAKDETRQAYALGDSEKIVTVAALRAYQFETERYLASTTNSGHSPCCEVAAARAVHQAQVNAALEQRQAAITRALAAFGPR